MHNHFYVYNECEREVSSTAYFLPVGKTSVDTHTAVALPGRQVFLCVTDENSISIEAVSVDRALRWQAVDVFMRPVDKQEYTHVIACNCLGSSCPDIWPRDTSRQEPSP